MIKIMKMINKPGLLINNIEGLTSTSLVEVSPCPFIVKNASSDFVLEVVYVNVKYDARS